jgi:hypothetical protein
MYANAKVRPVETVPGSGEGRGVNSIMIYLIDYKNLCKCYNVTCKCWVWTQHNNKKIYN